MSGIAGIICFDGRPVEAGLVEAMTSSMAHRGPDGICHWARGSVAVGQCILHATPESLEEPLPLKNDDEGVVLVLDGRLDNREELRHSLISRGASLRSSADGELILRAYETWGCDAPNALLGDFALAIWDAGRQRLFLARDHFGVRPLYYFCGSGYLAFASSEEAFLGLPGFPREVNEDFVAAMLTYKFDGGDFNRGWLRDALKVPPGSFMMVERTGRTVRQAYWQLQPQEESRFKSEGECEEAFRAVFHEAVRCRLRTSADPALMLSGGIDSASVAAVSREILGVTPARQLHTFSVVADDADSCAETNNIASICRGWEGLTHQVSLPSLRGGITLDDLKEAAWVHAHPDGNSRLIPAMMYLAANRRGHRVMLDGIDGDLATYTPPRYTASLLRAGAWRVAWAEAKHASMNNTFLQGKSPLSILSRSAWDAYAPTTAKWLKDMLWDSRQKNPFTNITIHHGLAARVGFSRRVKECRARSRRMRRQSDQERHIQVLTPPGIVSGLEGFDTEAARYGMESWHPWSDKRVIEFFVRLPVHYKVRDGWTKFPVRKTMEAQLQSHVVWNPRKEHLGAELMRRLMQDSHDETRSALRNAKAKLQEYLEPGSLRTIEGHVGKKVSDVDLWDLFTTASLAHWLNNVRLAPS